MPSREDDGLPTLSSADGRRRFSCFPAAVRGFIFNGSGEVLLLSHPRRQGAWEVVNGAVEAGESPVAALLRETAEEAGPNLQIRPVACVHSFLFRYDPRVKAMLSIAYAATYLSGDVVPGSDMTGSDFRWVRLSDIERGAFRIVVPAQTWLFQRAAAVHSLFKDTEVALEPWEDMDHVQVMSTLRSIVAGQTDDDHA